MQRHAKLTDALCVDDAIDHVAINWSKIVTQKRRPPEVTEYVACWLAGPGWALQLSAQVPSRPNSLMALLGVCADTRLAAAISATASPT
jgi:hypothetical protein